ncbi:MAG TPA: imidazole glycerol phosphate synthase subunit HisH [Candidatus Kapabacteria bacterium]|nr:imidazole glycerol phosphate synthase subunit HisH [Candidatus Kapabacteria bacterium]
MIGIIDYGSGNLGSVRNALDRLGAGSFVSSSPAELDRAEKLILPGVGAAGNAMRLIAASGLQEWLHRLEAPLLGICLGMQLMFEYSRENHTPCLGLVPGTVEPFAAPGLRTPHTGWNQVYPTADDPLFRDIAPGEYFYFVHSYYAAPGAATIATATYGAEFSAAVTRANSRGVQFHPEKSGPAGLRLLENFISLC